MYGVAVGVSKGWVREATTISFEHQWCGRIRAVMSAEIIEQPLIFPLEFLEYLALYR